ncbi:probable glutamate receptor [Zootermopsis nevadensis]|uniref:probable glutamate receptor n=1 Tax=Zootermopsis nevadensis TaxID=136037 RepID=UPI000B8EE170|nr:probable glutamate receptor [Zootermopsis nevadensis]
MPMNISSKDNSPSRKCGQIPSNKFTSSGFSAETELVLIQKHLSSRGVPAVTISNSSVHKLAMVRRQAINVLFRGTEDTKRYIKQATEPSTDRNFSIDIWVLFLDAESLLEEFFAGIYIPFDCEFLVAQIEDKYVSLTEVYHIGPARPLQTYRFGTWTARSGLAWRLIGFFRRRYNLQEQLIKVAYVDQKHALTETHNNGSKKITGFFVHVWNTIANFLNMKAVCQRVDTYGSRMENGSWNGIIQMVISNEVHVGVGDFTVTAGRSAVVDCLAPLIISSLNVFIRVPDQSGIVVWGRYVAPFSLGLWVAVATAVCALSFCLWLTAALQAREKKFAATEAMFYVFGTLCQQGQPDSAVCTAVRAVELTSYMTSLVLFAGYSAYLVSSQTVQHTVLPFRSLQGLLEDGSYGLGLAQNSSHLNLFDAETEGLKSIVYKTLISPHKNDMPAGNLEGFTRVCDSRHKYAFMASLYVGQYWAMKLPCHFTTLPDTFYPECLTFVISKNSPYKKLINWNLLRLRESGIQDRIRQEYLPPKPSYVNKSVISVDIISVAPILVVFFGGVVTAVAVLAIEHIVCICLRQLDFFTTPRKSKTFLL